MNLITYIQRSLAARLSIWVVGCVVFIFITAQGILFYYSRQAVREEAMERATQTLESTLLHVGNTLHDAEVAADNMRWLVEQHLETPDSMFTFSRKILENNPNLYGCSIAFEPYYYEEKGQYFSAYSYNGGDSIQTEQEGSDEYEYYYMDWYLIPKLLNKPYWVEPFHDPDVGGIYVEEYTTSFCQPIRDKEGKMVGVLSVDLALPWFSKTVLSAKPFPNSYSMLLGKGGTFLVHPDTTKQFYESIFTPTLEQPDSVRTALGRSMIAGESGYKVLHNGDEDEYVFYKPLSHTDWSVAIVCPENDIFEPYYRLQKNLITITVVGLLLLLFFSVFIIRYNLRPLKRLGASAEKMSEGDFHVSVPDSKRRDEIGQLQRSFSKMQRSLSEYINKIHHSTETLTERNEELLRASELAKEDDRIKLRPVKSDRDALARLFGEEEDFDPTSNLTLNYRFFCDQLLKEVVPVDELYAAIGKLEIISITLDHGDNAQLIFESLNSTGLALSEGDKIRNYVLMELPPKTQEKYYRDYWAKIEDCTKATRFATIS